MSHICTRDGHVVRIRRSYRDYSLSFCPEHGSPLFENCPQCRLPWQVDSPGEKYYTEAARFCPACSYPAPWATRAERITSIRDRLTSAANLDPETALQLREMVDKLTTLDANDTKAIEAWQRVREAAPKVWEACRPVLQTVVGEGVKKYLGL